MNTYIWMKRLLAILGSGLIGLMFSTGAYAANPEPVTVEVQFAAPITILETNALQFGVLDVNLAIAEEVIIAPDSSLTDLGGNVIGPTPAAATFDVIATPGRAINILVDTVTTGTGYSLGAWQCDYGAVPAAGACDGAGLSETSEAGPTELRVGVTLTGDAAPVLGNQDGSFNLTVAYQ